MYARSSVEGRGISSCSCRFGGDAVASLRLDSNVDNVVVRLVLLVVVWSCRCHRGGSRAEHRFVYPWCRFDKARHPLPPPP